jgi:hypothetical protein
MEASQSFESFVPAGLASLGVEADETDLAVMAGAHAIYWPAIRALMEAPVGAPPEPDPDLSRAPVGE